MPQANHWHARVPNQTFKLQWISIHRARMHASNPRLAGRMVPFLYWTSCKYMHLFRMFPPQITQPYAQTHDALSRSPTPNFWTRRISHPQFWERYRRVSSRLCSCWWSGLNCRTGELAAIYIPAAPDVLWDRAVSPRRRVSGLPMCSGRCVQTCASCTKFLHI